MDTQKDEKPWLAGLDDTYSQGNAADFDFHLSELRLRSGSVVPINPVGVTVIVGGNNVGKSTILREIHLALASHPEHAADRASRHVLESAGFQWAGSPADFLEWVAANNRWDGHSGHSSSGRPGFTPRSGGITVSVEDLLAARTSGHDSLGYVSLFLEQYAQAMDRFHYLQPITRLGNIGDTPVSPIQHLERTPGLLQNFQAAAKALFGIDVSLDRLSGNLFFRVGKPTDPAPPVDDIAGPYLEQMLALPSLHEQGEGIQSALGLLLPVLTAKYEVTIVDEPEAFLHPPQARKLGSTLARMAAERGVQLIVATHDRHFLTGILDAEEADISVVRLTRTDNKTVGKHLDSAKLREAWGTASLRHSNLLDGLFHKLVVIAENERDCRFYAAALEWMDSQGELPLTPHDVLFLPSAGKGNIPAIAEVLIASGVPVVASPDLDVLNNEQTMQRLYSTFGGDWDGLRSIYLAATAQFKNSKKPRKNRQVLKLVKMVLEEAPDDVFTTKTKTDLDDALRVENEWSTLKAYGMNAFSAEVTKAETVMGELEKVGVVPVRVGELECFAKEINLRKGNAWLEEALRTGVHKRTAVTDHLHRILASGGFPLT
ncbi:ATP-dependent nuclease [Arthrobacter sp. B10-11]|uniref:ATP-dependent nuclease n=1 Tax=Arthrobacter sp. B10-11 TaxID=3081160 RepID=UPI0029548199|nr:AAA family ATPase [Arthrobacter sp. B10-11]MDV8146257.1 AAA family ATPase [Arthrobacter sp. B10-11]